MDVAGYAPEFLPPGRSLSRWLTDLSDSRISLYMLLGALAIVVALYLLDKHILS